MLFGLVFLGSCHYSCPPKTPVSVSFPFVEGDTSGQLTQELVHAFYENPWFQYKNQAGDIQLHLKIISLNTEITGYRKDSLKGEKKYLRPIEGKSRVGIEVKAFSMGCTEPLFPPFQVVSEIDFDYVDGNASSDLSFVDLEGKKETVLRFSLGQLEPKDSAEEACLLPLYHDLAQKMVQQLLSYL